MENKISAIVISIFVHATIIIFLAVGIKFPVSSAKDKFKVLVYNLNPPAQPPQGESRTDLFSGQKSKGASRLGPEDNAEPKKGLKRGPEIQEAPRAIPVPPSPPMIPGAGMDSPARQIPPSPGQQAQKQQEKSSAGEKMKAAKKSGDFLYKSEEDLKEADDGKSEKNISEAKARQLEETLTAVRRGTPGQQGQPGQGDTFSPLNPDSGLLSKYAGLLPGLGGNDEDGEGGSGLTGGSGHVVSLDTTDLKYFSYFRHLKELIEGVWIYPKIAKERGIDGTLVIEFTISEDGTLAGAKVVKSSGFYFLDDGAVRALKDASPFPPLPKRWNKKELTIAGSFTYYLSNTLR